MLGFGVFGRGEWSPHNALASDLRKHSHLANPECECLQDAQANVLYIDLIDRLESCQRHIRTRTKSSSEEIDFKNRMKERKEYFKNANYF